jgi:hypothetical protein
MKQGCKEQWRSKALKNREEKKQWDCCVSSSEHPAHLAPTFCMSVFYPLSFLHLRLPPVRSGEPKACGKTPEAQVCPMLKSTSFQYALLTPTCKAIGRTLSFLSSFRKTRKSSIRAQPLLGVHKISHSISIHRCTHSMTDTELRMKSWKKKNALQFPGTSNVGENLMVTLKHMNIQVLRKSGHTLAHHSKT